MTSRCFWAAGMAAFRRRKTLPSGPIPIPLVGDFNGDGWLDLVVANQFSTPGSVSVLLGNRDGSFQGARTVNAGTNPNSVAMGDFNGDGWLDLAVVDYQSLLVLLGNGDGTFRAARPVSFGDYPVFVAVADFNGDGWRDLAVANAGFSNYVSVFLGNGDASFQYPRDFAVARNPQFVSVADFNGDGWPDLAVANEMIAGSVS